MPRQARTGGQRDPTSKVALGVGASATWRTVGRPWPHRRLQEAPLRAGFPGNQRGAPTPGAGARRGRQGVQGRRPRRRLHSTCRARLLAGVYPCKVYSHKVYPDRYIPESRTPARHTCTRHGPTGSSSTVPGRLAQDAAEGHASTRRWRGGALKASVGCTPGSAPQCSQRSPGSAPWQRSRFHDSGHLPNDPLDEECALGTAEAARALDAHRAARGGGGLVPC